jgi:uncharacterized protein YodC (DUF2158 family)
MKVGDVVMLKSGGPRMVISEIDGWEDEDGNTGGGYLCVWFNANGEIKKRVFEKSLLVLVEPD